MPGRARAFDLLGAESAPFRRGPAYAKSGHERYGIGPDLRGHLHACPAQSGDAPLPLAARAARANLDVCFFRQSDDGDGRSVSAATCPSRRVSP